MQYVKGYTPKVDSPPFDATVAAAALSTALYQEDPVYHPLGLGLTHIYHESSKDFR